MTSKVYLTNKAINNIKKKSYRSGYEDGVDKGCSDAAKAIEATILGKYEHIVFQEGTEDLQESLARLNLWVQAHRDDLH